MKIDEVFRYEHLENLKASPFISYPEHQKYFMYGDAKGAYISHVITKHKDFHQVFHHALTFVKKLCVLVFFSHNHRIGNLYCMQIWHCSFTRMK